MTQEPQPQEPRAAAVLMVEDAGRPGVELTERLGVALYGRFLECGRYARVVALQGRQDANERLSRAIRELAAAHEHVDVFCSVHTISRAPDEWARLVPPGARKLRLVYSTACYGAQEERRAWAAVGARTIVTHVGINNPLVALPLFLSRWLTGEQVEAAAASGYRETALAMRFVAGLPGLVGGPDLPSINGSRPVIEGDRALTIGLPVALPRELLHERARGGAIGLALRALTGARVAPDELRPLLERAPRALLGRALDALLAVDVERTRGGEARLSLRFAREAEVPLEGLTLRLGERVTLWPGVADPDGGRLVVHTSGLTVSLGPVDMTLKELALTFDPAQGVYRARAAAALWGWVPIARTFVLGGRTPPPLTDDGPLFVT
jgi:hypothetical protein